MTGAPPWPEEEPVRSLCDGPPAAPATAEPAPAGLPPGVPALRAFYLYLSTSCNLACRHCWITPRFVNGRPDPGDVIDPDALRGAVREGRPLGLRSAKLTGGEPLLHPRFREIADMLTAEGLGLDMETNGTLLTAELARHLKAETRLGFVSVSLDGADAATHDAFRGVRGAFEGALRGLGHLTAAGYTNVQVIMSVHRGNRAQVAGVIALARARGAGSVKLNPVTNTGRGAAMHRRGEGLDFAERLALAREVDGELRPGAGIGLVLNLPPALTPLPELERRQGRMGDCGVCGILGILGTGEIALCGIGRTIPELVYGRLGRDRIRELWLRHPTILGLRRTLEDTRGYPGVCAECLHASRCRTGCVAQNYVEAGALAWPSWLCTEAARRGQFPATRRRAAGA